MVISGQNLSGATAVYFGSLPAAIVPGSDTGNQITVLGPADPHPDDALVTVDTAGGPSPNSVYFQYFAVPGPVVTGVTPANGPAGSGAGVTIYGSGFTGATAVDFGSTPASFTFIADGTITATVPGALPAAPAT